MAKIPDPDYQYFPDDITAHKAGRRVPPGWVRPLVEREVRYLLTAVDPKDGRRKVLRTNGRWV